MYYLRIENSSFTLVRTDWMEALGDSVRDTDIPITEEDYNKFYELNSQAKQFKLKINPIGATLFDYIEEYTPNNGNVEAEATKEEKLNNKILSLQATIIKMQFNSCIFNYKFANK
ncbi:hypothetical protein NNC19_07155 [Clostridium sp. SHJSY1]|uniref:hypothetical protein n=1 Tax=Clostridium sp. SHJSY1 TaxID=2942483 RepID=UPI002874EE60|nr:hypothetical protein [Clostridium sp. SHJSY1]MDS0525451.1 hypothetical protein [Clostridium sp. SHJSY1]